MMTMSDVREPTTRAPWPPLASNDPFYRWPERYRVGQQPNESFVSIARRNGVDASTLVQYNFQTRSPREINWYLANYVGCRTPKPGQHFTFEGAVYDERANRGVIFIPRFGTQARDHTNRLGERVVDNYNRASNKTPGGRCYDACYARVSDAGRQVGMAVPAFDAASAFSRLWGSLIRPRTTWLELPEDYRGKGAPGAMASEGLGTLVDSAGIWSGRLRPGAVIQTWRVAADFDRVRDGHEPSSYGHSFIFLNYVYAGAGISGMAIADQGFQNDAPVERGEYGYWVGANLGAAGAAPT
jgi:hypothetical protein